MSGASQVQPRTTRSTLPERVAATNLADRPVGSIDLQRLFAFIFIAYAIVLSPLVDAGLRNYLVIFAAAVGAFCLASLELPIRREVAWVSALLFYMLVSVLLDGHMQDLWSVALTFLYIVGYLAAGGLFANLPERDALAGKVLKMIIYAFAAVSILQMIASLAGLPVPNLLGSKGLWSYNSLSMEPSQVGRIVGISFLAFLTIARKGSNQVRLSELFTKHRNIFLAFVTAMLLSGSALAFAALIVVLVISRGAWLALVLAVGLVAALPVLLSIDFAPLQRSVLLLTSLSVTDPYVMMKAEGSGASRLLPGLIYLRDASVDELGFWLGYGSDGLTRFFLGRIPGFGDVVPAGFYPGYLVFYGLIGFLLFLWVFLFRLMNMKTLPVISFWIIFFSTSAVNTQVVWYGLLVIWICYLSKSYVSEKRATT